MNLRLTAPQLSLLGYSRLKQMALDSLFPLMFCLLALGLSVLPAGAASRRESKNSPKQSPKQSQTQNKVIQTFAFFGCNRIDPKDYEATKATNPSSANVPQLRQNLADIATLAPDYLFLGGDLVMGYADDKGETLRTQMTAWIDLLKMFPLSSKTHAVAISGNHELNRKVGEAKIPNLVTDAIWIALVKQAKLIPADAKGPTAATDKADNLVDDQRALNFSFTRGGVHFVVLNTDTRVSTLEPATKESTKETKVGMVPTHWLEADLDAAEKNSKVLTVVVMGHRNLIDPETFKGDAPIDTECVQPMIHSLETHKKVRAYICAHVHAFDISPIGTSGIRQTVFGNGGSPLDKNWKPAQLTFGFGYFKVYADGSLGVVPYLRPVPANYLDSRPEMVPSAKAEPELIIPVR